MAHSDPTYTYKFILLGDLDVGKTSFFLRLKHGTYDQDNAYRGAEPDQLEYTLVVDGDTVKVQSHVQMSSRHCGDAICAACRALWPQRLYCICSGWAALYVGLYSYSRRESWVFTVRAFIIFTLYHLLTSLPSFQSINSI